MDYRWRPPVSCEQKCLEGDRKQLRLSSGRRQDPGDCSKQWQKPRLIACVCIQDDSPSPLRDISSSFPVHTQVSQHKIPASQTHGLATKQSNNSINPCGAPCKLVGYYYCCVWYTMCSQNSTKPGKFFMNITAPPPPSDRFKCPPPKTYLIRHIYLLTVHSYYRRCNVRPAWHVMTRLDTKQLHLQRLVSFVF